MTWLLFAVSAGVAIWAAAATRSGAIGRERGRPIAWGAGATAALLLAMAVWTDVQERRAAGALMQEFGEARRSFDQRRDNFDRSFEERTKAFDRRADAFDRNFKASSDAFDREFKARNDAFDRTFQQRRDAIGSVETRSQFSRGASK